MSASRALDIQSLEQLQATLPWEGTQSPEPLQEAARQASALAVEAFERRTPEALERAERLLHYLNVSNAFGVPVHPIASAVWAVLSQALVRGSLPKGDAPAEIDQPRMRAALEALIARAEQVDHPFLDAICELPTEAGLVLYAKNWLASTQGFTSNLLALAQRTTGATRGMILGNVSDEVSGQTHERMRARFFAQLGMSYDEVRGISTYQAGRRSDPELLISSLTLLNFRSALVANAHPTWALGVFFAMEAAFHRVCVRLVSALRRRRFDAQAMEIFTVHVEADEDHAKEWLEILESDAWSATDRARILQGTTAYMALRHDWFNAMKAALRLP
ncbi:MAG: iron-containing redox enzyme family protein [Hyalangium sp.]|uniref:iron-containing redox enzyme family protein n=1 Tax=Hyalangium sp. TaxID=2028555 RepID=UPI00389A2B09